MQAWPDMAPFVAQFRSLNDLSYAEYGHKQLKSRAVGRVAFAGDAAHSMSPQLGQACDTPTAAFHELLHLFPVSL